MSNRPAEGAAPGPVVVVLPVFSELLLLILMMAGSCLLHDDGETEPDHVSAVEKNNEAELYQMDMVYFSAKLCGYSI